MPKFSVLFARFPFGNQECPDSVDWLVATTQKAIADERIGKILHTRVDDTPITMGRNRVMHYAADKKVDLLLMIDSDVSPDIGLKPGSFILNAKPFWETALDFILQHKGPAVIAAPYCGPPPHENVYVFKPANRQSDNPNTDIQIEQFTREEAAQRGGIEQVFALPTGLMLIDMRCVEKLRDPFFDYEWELDGAACEHCGQKKPGPRANKSSTEDVYFSRNLALGGVPQYCLWDAWCGHNKRKLVGKPQLLTMDSVMEQYRAAILRGANSDEQLIMLGDGVDANAHPDLPCVDGPARPGKSTAAKQRAGRKR